MTALSVFRSQRELLLNLLKHCLLKVANTLFAEGMISEEVYETASNTSKSPSERGVALIDCLETRLKAFPEDFRRVVEILETEPYLRTLVECLNSESHL